MALKTREFDLISDKLEMQTRDTKHRIAIFSFEGKKVLWTKRSHGRGDLTAADLIRQQLKLNEQQMKDLIGCSIDRDGYIEILKNKGVIDIDS